MKKRLHNKKAGIALLITLILVTLAEVVFRALAAMDVVYTTSNAGEQLATIILAVLILIFTAANKDRLCYICYGAWIGYFVLDQLFELPGFVIQLLTRATVEHPMGTAVMILYAVSMIGIIAIGVLLVEYMNDGSIYNRAFNVICVITFLAILLPVLGDAFHITVQKGDPLIWLSVFNNLRRAVMILIFTFFAYDSAKHQLKKTDFSK